MPAGKGGIIRVIITMIAGIGVWTVASYAFAHIIPLLISYTNTPGQTATSDLTVNLYAWFAGIIMIILYGAYSLLHEAFINRGY